MAKQRQKNKQWFTVEEDETLTQCLERMAKEGYMPIRRREEPVFKEVDGEVVYSHQLIQFQGQRQ